MSQPVNHSPIENSVFLEAIKEYVSHVEYGLQGIKSTLEDFVGTPYIFEIQELVEKLKS